MMEENKEELKQCTKTRKDSKASYCDKWKPIFEFYNGRSQCKECHNKSRRKIRNDIMIVDGIELKQCTNSKNLHKACWQWKSISEFEFREDTKTYRNQCMDCLTTYHKQYNEDNKEEIKIKRKQFRQDNKERLKAENKQWRKNNKEYIKIKGKEYYDANKDDIKEYQRTYKKNNKEKARKSENNAKNKRRKNDPIWALKKDASRMIALKFKKRGISKNGESSSKYFPWTDQELYDYITALFSHPDNLTPDGKVWMTMNNRGIYDPKTWNDDDPTTWTWQIDHIKPQSTFKFDTMDCSEFRDYCGLINLRPLRSDINIKDKNNRTLEQIAKIKKEIRQFLDNQNIKKEA